MVEISVGQTFFVCGTKFVCGAPQWLYPRISRSNVNCMLTFIFLNDRIFWRRIKIFSRCTSAPRLVVCPTMVEIILNTNGKGNILELLDTEFVRILDKNESQRFKQTCCQRVKIFNECSTLGFSKKKVSFSYLAYELQWNSTLVTWEI